MQVVAHAERRADVLQVVLDDRAAVLRDQRVERVRGLEIGEVRPRAEDAQRAQLAAMLVRHEVVGIVGTRAGVEEAAENLAGNQPAGDDAIGAVRRCARRVSRMAFMSSLRERRSLAGRPADRGLRDRSRRASDRRWSGTIRPGCSRAPRRSSSRPATAPVAPSGNSGGSNSRNQVSPLASLAVKPGCAPAVFSLISTQCDGSGGAPTIRAAHDLVGGDRRRADPVGEPARVRHLVDRVDVLRARAGRLVAGGDEQVVRHLVQLTDARRAAPSSVLRLRLARDRIVRIEARPLRRDGAGERAERDDQTRSAAPARRDA